MRAVRLALALLFVVPATAGAVDLPVRADGTVSTKVALKAFDAAVAPLPGVKGPRRFRRLESGTGPALALLAHRKRLEPRQRRALRKALPRPGRAAGSSSLQSLQQTFTSAYERLDARVKDKLFIEHELVIGPVSNAGAVTYPVGDKCVTKAPPAQLTETDGVYLRELAVHELVHCIQIQIGTPEYLPWRDEGSAQYLAALVAVDWSGKASATMRDIWSQYFKAFTQVLFKHGYSGMGFFGQLARGSSADSVIKDLFVASSAPTSEKAYAKLITGDFKRTGASSGTRLASLGEAWDTGGPGLPDPDEARYDPPSVVVGNATVQVQAKAYANTVLGLNPGQGKPAVELDVMTVPSAWGLLHYTEGDHDLQDLSKTFCLRDGQACQCPSGVVLPRLGDDAYIALHGFRKAAEVRLVPRTIEEACDSGAGTRLKVGGAFNMTVESIGACGHASDETPETFSASFNKVITKPPFQEGEIQLSAGRLKTGTFTLAPNKPPEQTGATRAVHYVPPTGGWSGTERDDGPAIKSPGKLRITRIDTNGAVSGTVNARVLSEPPDPYSSVTITGHWRCVPYDLILPGLDAQFVAEL